MMNAVSVDYIERTELNEHGEAMDKAFALHIFDNSNEKVIEHTRDFQKLRNKVNLSNLIEYLQEHFPEFFEVITDSKYLYFNGVFHHLQGLGYDAEGKKVA